MDIINEYNAYYQSSSSPNNSDMSFMFNYNKIKSIIMCGIFVTVCYVCSAKLSMMKCV